MKKVIIIGAGHAGVQAANELRKAGFEGRIVLISNETDFPYQKPPLSKDFLKGKITEANLAFRSENFYEKNQIELTLGVWIEKIDVEQKNIIAKNGQSFEFDDLIIATGADNRPLRIEGNDLEGVVYLRTLSDAKRLQKHLSESQKITVIGGGFIGLEVAAAAIGMGKSVTVIEAQERLMQRVLPPVISDVFKNEHQNQGVELIFNGLVTAIKSENGQIKAVVLQDDRKIKTDMVAVGIGVVPNEGLAKAAGIACKNGILVNENMQTSHPNIYAIGDVASYFNPFAQQQMRLESVQNANDQAKIAALSIVGNPSAYHAVPWFWTNQYRLKLQMAGFNTDFDEYIIRGNQTKGKFSVFYYKNKKLIGVDSLNKPSDHLAARKLLAAGISPTKEQVLDLKLKLKTII